MSGPRIALFAHSTNPRGGVVHAMQLAEALCDRGHDATLLAPAAGPQQFFRTPRCAWLLIPASPAPHDVVRLVETRRREIASFLRHPGTARFDILHAQDSLSALALSDLAESGRIAGYVRTVHHLDRFGDPRLSAWQDEAVRNATELFCVSRLWQRELRQRFGRSSILVGNGVDADRFTPCPGSDPDGRDAALRRRLLPQGGRMVLALGGIEARKNTLATLRAFLRLMQQAEHPDLHLVIAGGASLLDHAEARLRFETVLRSSGHAGRVVLAGIIEDAEMASLYRIASALCFPSLAEGFGLCVLEAMASGIPVIVPHGPPFDEYLDENDAILVDPASDQAIAQGIEQALSPGWRQHARIRGPARARDFGWQHVAARHLAGYSLLQPERLPPEPVRHA